MGLFGRKKEPEKKDIRTGKGFKSLHYEGKSIRVLIFDEGNHYDELDDHISNGFVMIGFSGKLLKYAVLNKPQDLISNV